MRWTIVFAMAAAAAALLGGCGNDSATDSGSILSTEDGGYETLEAREAAHRQAALVATDTRALRDETHRYATDMDSLMDEMIERCTGSGGRGMGMMHDDWMDEMHDAMDSMSDFIHAHHARMDTISSLEVMREECEAHSETMQELMAELDWDTRHMRHMR